MTPLAQALIDAAASLVKEDGPGFIAAFKAHDWKTVAEDVVLAELALAAAAGVPGASIAVKVAPLFIGGAIYAAQHPADTNSPEMLRADGNRGGEPTTNIGSA
jgi:hypothetical protein